MYVAISTYLDKGVIYIIVDSFASCRSTYTSTFIAI